MFISKNNNYNTDNYCHIRTRNLIQPFEKLKLLTVVQRRQLIVGNASGKGSSVAQRVHGPAQALGEWAVPVQDQPELLDLATDLGELADDDAALDLRGSQEEGGGQVDNERVDLAVVQRELGVVVGVVFGASPSTPR